MRVGPGWVALAAVPLVWALPAQVAQTPKAASAEISAWKGRLTELQLLLESRRGACEHSHPLTIVDAGTLKDGDGVSVALVDYCNGGAYADDIATVRLQNGLPVLVQMRGANGQIIPAEFSQGASVMHYVNVTIAPGRNAIYAFEQDNKDDGHGGVQSVHCSVAAYVWEGSSGMFVWSRALSRERTRVRCPGAPHFVRSR